MAAPESLSLSKVISETDKITKLHACHYEALLGLFLYPMCLALVLYPTIYQHVQSISSDNKRTLYQYFLVPLFYTLFVNLLSSLAVASISHSTYHLSLDEPVDLISSIKSTRRSFWRLALTSLPLSLIAVLITAPCVVLVLFIEKRLHNSHYLFPCVVLASLVWFACLTCLQVKWIMACVVAVLESKRGFASLERSAYLVTGNRRVAMSMLLRFELTAGAMYWVFSYGWMSNWIGIIGMISSAHVIGELLLRFLVATVQLYICTKEYQGRDADKLPLLEDVV